MNPFGVSGLFQSTANQGANSFQDPMSLSRLYPGWGMNPAYQTPAYDAPYRPQYSGPNAYAAYGPTGFWRGAGNIVGTSLGADMPYWGNPISSMQDSANAVGQTPFDAGMRVGQRFIAPAVSIGVATAVLAPWARVNSKLLARGVMSGMGMSPGMAMKMGTVVAGLFGSFAIPFAVGTAVTHAVDAAVFQPYARSRMMGQATQDSFAGITLGDGGNSITGRGLSSYQSARIGSAIDSAGIRDMTFSASQFSGMASMGMRAGLFDDVGSQSGIIKRASEIASQVKTILAISRDPNIANAIEELGKLRLGGASISGGAFSQASSAYRSMGMYASIGGTSVQRLMSESGMQGQYMFQMNGMIPYMGQLAAGNAFSSFAAAQRVGVLSNTTLARMGGVSGATQSALAAQLTEQSTMFAKMQMHNKYMTGGSTNGVVNTVSAFGANAARDPVSTLGSMILNGGTLASLDSQDPAASEKRMVQLMQSLGMKRGAGGKFSSYQMAAVMSGMGMPPEQIIAYTNMRRAQTDPDTLAVTLKSIKAQTNEQVRQVLEQEGIGAGIGDRIVYGVSRGWKSMKQSLAHPAYLANQAAGSAADSVLMAWDWWKYGRSIDQQKADLSGDFEVNIDNLYKTSGGHAYKNSTQYRTMEIARELNRSANEGGDNSELARKLLRYQGDLSSPEAKELFAQYLKGSGNPELQKAYESLNSSSAIAEEFSAVMKGNIVAKKIPEGVKKASDAEKTLTDQAESLHALGGPIGLKVEDFLKDSRYSALANSLSGKTTQQKIDKINALTKQSLLSKGKRFNPDADYDAISKLIATVNQGSDQERKAVEASTSEVSYGKDILESGKMNLRAANIMFDAVNRFNNTVGPYGQNTQRSAK